MDIEEFNRQFSLLERRVNCFEMSVRLWNCIKNNYGDDVTVREIVTKSESEFFHIRGVGPRLIQELKEILSTVGLTLSMNAALLPGYKADAEPGVIKKYRQLVLNREAVLSAVQKIADKNPRMAEFLRIRFGLRDENDRPHSISEIAEMMQREVASVRIVQDRALRALGRELLGIPVTTGFVEWITGYDIVPKD